jgi:hypothetical protein
MLTLLRVALFFKTIAAEFQARARTSSDALSFGQSAWSAILSDRDECKCRRGNLLSDFLRSVSSPCLDLDSHGTASSCDKLGVKGDLVSNEYWTEKSHGVDG